MDQPRKEKKIRREARSALEALVLLWLSTPWPETGARLSSDEVMIPATIPKTEGIVRERRERGFDLGASQRGLLRKKEGATGGHGWRPASSWRALYMKEYGGSQLGRGGGRCGMPTVEAIELWWPNAGDRRGVLSSVQK